VERLQVMGFRQVFEVNFGASSPNDHQANKRAFMWNRMKDWLLRGAIDPADSKLAQDFAGPGYHINRQNKLVLESKQDTAKRGEASPDDGDALALTFAQDVAPVLPPPPREPEGEWSQWG
jgi:phage terminase large subunit